MIDLIPLFLLILLAVVVLWPSRARNADISDYAEHGGRTVGL